MELVPVTAENEPFYTAKLRLFSRTQIYAMYRVYADDAELRSLHQWLDDNTTKSLLVTVPGKPFRELGIVEIYRGAFEAAFDL